MATSSTAPLAMPARSPHTRQNNRGRSSKPRRNAEQGYPAENDPSSALKRQDSQRHTQPPGDGASASQPTPPTPFSHPSSASEASSAENSAVEGGALRQQGSLQKQRGRGGRLRDPQRARGHGGSLGIDGASRGPASSRTHHPMDGGAIPGSGRQFGGRLTASNEVEIPSPLASSLQADASEFHPGQQHKQRTRANQKKQPVHPQPNEQTPRLRRGSSIKSEAPDIATRTHEDIMHGAYECPICTSDISRHSKIWSCKTCWTVFHLPCIKRWSKNEGSTAAQSRTHEGETPIPRQWRCPGCNLPKNELPSSYTCWCEKEVDPRTIAGIPPHSCGQTCGKSRMLPKNCPHPCELLCHAGPCPPCSHMGPVQECFCKKKSRSKRCVDTNYDTGWCCGEVCKHLMLCGEHTCQRPCHEGSCGACEVEVEARCYCGGTEKQIPCCKRGVQHQSSQYFLGGNGEQVRDDWSGTFDCGNICQRLFDCGIHVCEKQCHPKDLNIPHCPRSPDVVSHCPCGKTAISEISSIIRQSCKDPIPHCTQECLKRLACGHLCQQICHSGPCLPCTQRIPISCVCGRTVSQTICHQGTEDAPQCTRTCKSALNCGRHECGERCCSGERKAAERQATKRKLRPLGLTPRAIDEAFEAEHICTRLCGRALKCGNHICPELCHKGPCNSCREAVFEEVSCYCGRTVIQPPLPCGTRPPPCRFDCERQKSCGHPQVPHNCHGDDDSCPKCPFLTLKACMCGKKILKNQQCWLNDVRCGDVCGKKLRCGLHHCRKQCHRPGECEDSGTPCQQACGKAKKICSHPCEESCHAPSSCREDKLCQNKMIITCECQHLKQEIKCLASKSGEGNSKKILKCDDECAKLERNRKLALALNIDPQAHKDNHIPYSTDTLKIFQQNVKWAQIQEREFRVFAADEAEKRLRFKPMSAHQRTFVHALAEDFGFDSESMDQEPHRHVAVFKTPKFVMAPMKTLAECVRIRTTLDASNNAIIETQKRLRTNNEPYNGTLLSNPRFGLTLEELRTDLAPAFGSAPSLAFEISFLPSEEIVLKARPATASTSVNIEATLKALKSSLASTVEANHLATSLQLCTLDASLNILRREVDSTDAEGWSQVAAKAAAPRSAPKRPAVGEKSVYTILGSRLKDAKKKKEEERRVKEADVVEDWEEEARREEVAGDESIEGKADKDVEADVGNARELGIEGLKPMDRLTNVGNDSHLTIANAGAVVEDLNEDEVS